MTTAPSVASTADRATLGPLLVTLMAFSLAVWLSWTGFIGSDDAVYAGAASHWLQHGPYLANNHFALRLPTVLPIAASFRIFGLNEAALILPTLLFGAAIAVVFAHMACRTLGLRRAPWAIVFFVTSPLFASMNSTAGVDLSELFFDLSSLSLFMFALEKPRARLLLFLCGALAGLGWMSRETSVFLFAFYGLLFLLQFRMQRRMYFLIAAGILFVAGGEMLSYYFLTGDPLYRLTIDFRHDLVDRNTSYGLFDQEGNLHVGGVAGAIIDPLLMLFFNKQFGLLFWLAIPAVGWFFRSQTVPTATKSGLRIILLAGLVWFLGLVLLFGKLYLVPRYALLPLCATAMLVGAWIAYDLAERSTGLTVGLFGLAIVANILAANLDNRDFLYPERMLVIYARSENRMIFTDRETFRRGLFLLDSEGLSGHVSDRKHQLGDLFFYVPDNATVTFAPRRAGVSVSGSSGQAAQADAQNAGYVPLPGEKLVTQFVRPEGWFPRLISALGIASLIPEQIMHKLRGNHREVFVYAAASH